MTIKLPGGLWLDGTRHEEAVLRPLDGDDEAFLLETSSLLPAQRTTALLARCMTRLGPLRPVATEAAASLTFGDREALLLHLRRLSIGEHLQCVLSCPDPLCREKMDLDLLVSDLLLPPYPHARERYETTIPEKNGDIYRVYFRLPTGANQEEAAALARSDPQAAADLLLRRCVEEVVAEDGQQVEDLPPVIIDQLPTVIAELDPQAELVLSPTCPACDHVFSALFDTAAYLFQELDNRAKHIYGEVHLLALYYHWSEAEIMRMTPRKRRLYLDLLAGALAEGRS